MKTFLASAVLFLSFSASSQYYYKDILGTRESSNLIAAYHKNNVESVTLKSYTINNTPLEGLSVQQFFSPAAHTLQTVTKSDFLPASYLTTFFDETGRMLKTTDSAAGGPVNTTLYEYTVAGELASMTTTFGDPQAPLKSDQHLWQYDSQGRPVRMLRVRNGKDSATVNLKLDENGNVVEEQETIRFIKEEPVYYYYDSKNRLTDIVRYNKKAARLLPEQMFEYATSNQLIQRTTVPQNSDNYFIWRYRFDPLGLKKKEEIYNKQKELTGAIEYTYTFGK